MANEIQPGSRVVRVPAPRGPANAGPAAGAMTPKEIAGILRRHVFMIIVFTPPPLILLKLFYKQQ